MIKNITYNFLREIIQLSTNEAILTYSIILTQGALCILGCIHVTIRKY